jgi:hypothetical protein
MTLELYCLISSIRHVDVSRLHNARPLQVELANTDQSSHAVLLIPYLHAYLIPLLPESQTRCSVSRLQNLLSRREESCLIHH